jgi:multiple sugar transport system substrate-binding protein
MAPKLTRRKFVATTGAAAGAAVVGFPHIRTSQAATKISIGVLTAFFDSMTQILTDLKFTETTGIEVEVKVRPGTPPEMITQMSGAIQAGNTPYDVIDFEDECASTFSRAGFLLGLDDALPSGFWDDFSQPMLDMRDTWDVYNGETFRIHHNFEPCYWWYRKDQFDAKGVAVPKTWEDVAALGEVFTDESNNVWATGDGLAKGAFLNVYVAYITRQAGGDPFQADDHYKAALQYIYDLMHSKKTFNPGCLQKDYDAINQDYIADRIMFMRQWPFFYDVSRAAKDWFAEDKVVVTLPPTGPAGAATSTYAAGWGYGVPKTTKNAEAAKTLVEFLTDTKNAAPMALTNTWYLNSRKSVLEAVGDKGTAAYLKMYTDAGVIGTRPFTEHFVEGVAVVEDAASAYLSDQISLGDAVEQTKTRMGQL